MSTSTPMNKPSTSLTLTTWGDQPHFYFQPPTNSVKEDDVTLAYRSQQNHHANVYRLLATA